MNITAKVERVLRFLCILSFVFAFVVSVTGCAKRAPSAPNATEYDSAIRQERMAENMYSEPQVLSSVESDGLGIELTQEAGEAQMIIRTAEGKVDYKVSRLSEPARLVLDIMNGEQRLNRVFDDVDSNFVQRIRIGAHSDKSRVVLDLREVEGFGYDAEAIGGALILRLSGAELASKQAQAEPEMMAQPNFVEESAPVAEENLQEAVVEESSVDVAQNNAPEKSQPTGPVLRGVRIEPNQSQGNTLIADMSSAGFFTLQRTAPSEYVLRLEGATFDNSEVGTLLAPPKSGAIRSVRPATEGSDTLLRIFTDPAKKLAARTQGSKIIVEEEFFAPNTPEARAQAEVEEATEAADGADVELGDEADLSDLESEVSALLDEAPKYTGRQISLDLQDTDIDNALRIIAEVSNLNIIASDDVAGKVTLRLIDVPWDQALDVILKTNGLDKVIEGNVMRIAPIEKLRQEREALKQAQEAEEELEPLVVKYVRISYAKASELRSLVETVLTERGTVAYDERTNQLIVKDIRRGVKNVAELVARLDLRTPQVLLETQIVEAQRSFLREFGSEIGFSYIASPETGNPTGNNFPNSVNFGGSVDPALPGIGSSFPAAVDLTGGSAVSLLLDSADGTRSLDLRLSALEREGRVRIVSRPAVATTNNQQAIIKSVEKIRVKTPQGGLSVATGSGASASGSGGVATETIEIGIVLEVTPQASPDYFVLLDINAKSSTLGSTVVDGIPSEVERSATSTVLVSSGQTFAMGGIYKITDRDAVDGIPFLKDVPFLGHLFRTQQVDNADEELIFFITPRIVEGSFDDAAMKISS